MTKSTTTATKSAVKAYRESQKKLFKDMTDKEQAAYLKGLEEAKAKDGLATELIQIVPLKDKEGNNLPPKLKPHANGKTASVLFHLRRADYLYVDGELTPRREVPLKNTDEGEAFYKEHEVKSVFGNASMFIGEGKDKLRDFYMGVKAGQYFNLTHILAKDSKKYLSVWDMFEAKELNKKKAPAEAAATVAETEEIPY